MTDTSHIDENFAAFMEMFPSLPADKHGKYALMRDKKIVEYFDSAGDGMKAGRLAFPDHRFSVQKVTMAPINLGIFSYAVPHQPL